jgi:thiosulfate reductase cytochrome b subunit
MHYMTQDVAKRHRLSTRIWHWLNALVATILLMSGLMIFNAHPQLYWGDFGSREDYAWLQIDDTRTTGFVRIGSTSVETTGVLGLSLDAKENVRRVAFPGWATIPTGYDLAAARRWHFAFAWVFALGLTAFMFMSLVNGHIRKDLHVRRAEWNPRALWNDIKNHARLRFGDDYSASHYNIMQKFSYIRSAFCPLQKFRVVFYKGYNVLRMLQPNRGVKSIIKWNQKHFLLMALSCKLAT